MQRHMSALANSLQVVGLIHRQPDVVTIGSGRVFRRGVTARDEWRTSHGAMAPRLQGWIQLSATAGFDAAQWTAGLSHPSATVAEEAATATADAVPAVGKGSTAYGSLRSEQSSRTRRAGVSQWQAVHETAIGRMDGSTRFVWTGAAHFEMQGRRAEVTREAVCATAARPLQCGGVLWPRADACSRSAIEGDAAVMLSGTCSGM